jgi:predicted HicB family RNase H-like nuclease
MPKEPTVRQTVRIPRSISEQLWAESAETKKSINTLICEALAEKYQGRLQEVGKG